MLWKSLWQRPIALWRSLKGRTAFRPVVVLSDGLWKRSFASDPQIVGKGIYFADQRLTVVA